MSEPTPIRAHRRYTKRQKAEVVGVAVVEGVTEAERQTGIPKQTIDYWVHHPEFGHLRTTAREVVVEQFWVGIQVGLKEVVEGLRGDAPLHHKAEALKTLADRYALLSGEATSRTETRDLTARLDEGQADQLMNDIDEWLKSRVGDDVSAE